MINSQHYAHHVALVGMIHLLSLSESIEQLTQNTLWQTALILNLLLTSLLLFSTWSRKTTQETPMKKVTEYRLSAYA